MGMILGRVRALLSAVPRPAPTLHGRVRKPTGFGIAGWFILACICGSVFEQEAAASQYARLDYNVYVPSLYRHTIFLELFDDRPITTANFLQYVNANKYDSSMIHRVVSGFVLQGGGYYPQFVPEPQTLSPPYSFNPNLVVDLDGNSATTNPTIANEFGNSPARLNMVGTVAMAQVPGDPNSASNQWFINLANNTNLDVVSNGSGPYTVFGKVAGDGMTYITSLLGNPNFYIRNMNPDTNDDGQREAGPFDTAPLFVSGGFLNPVTLINVDQIDYFGSNLTTNVPAGGLALTARDAFIDTGTTFTGTGILTIGAGRTLGIREGFALPNDMINHGTLAPGLELGSATVSGYAQFSDGKLNIQLAGTTVDTQYDRLVVTGAASLGGDLNVSLLNGFAPAAGNSFTVLTASLITGVFGTFELPQLSSGLVWNISRTSTAYTLSVAAADFNRNGVVDMDDYILWRKTRNTSTTPYAGADANGDGLINDADFTIWRNNFGNVSGTAGAGSGSLVNGSVPEPACAVLLFCGMLPLMLHRGHRAARGC